MSVINYVTGYHGFTTEPGYGDNNGYVKKCIVAIEFPYQVLDVDFNISTGSSDWGAQMGDGTIIPLASPVVLSVGKNNAFVQFDMSVGYPSNSPLFLVYRSDTAYMSTNVRNDNRPITIGANSVTGRFASTTEPGYGDNNGYVKKCIATVTFPFQPDVPAFVISTGSSDWGIRMGNGSIIALSNPKVLAVNHDSAVIEFDMATAYPSNSPCILVYRSSSASYTIVPTAKGEYVAVTNITSPTTSCILGDKVDLSNSGVEPYNATYKAITWSIVSGPGQITDGGAYFQGTGTGNVVVRGTVKKSNGSNDFYKDFTINVKPNNIVIVKQPNGAVIINSGSTASLSVQATATSKVIQYQWYTNRTNSVSGATPVVDATTDELLIPNNLDGGVYYFFCRVSAPYTTPKDSILSKVTINVLPANMEIIPNNPALLQAKQIQLSIEWIPSNVTNKDVLWSSSNTNVATVDNQGILRTFGIGNSTITATTFDGSMTTSTVCTVSDYTSVSDITGIPSDMYVGDVLTLSGTVVPSNAVSKNISWSIFNNDAGATITGDKLVCTTNGHVVIRATIEDGVSEGTPFTKEFTIDVKIRFIPVSDVIIYTSLDEDRYVGDSFIISGDVSPTNSTEKNITWSIISDNAVLNDNIVKITEEGNIVIRATVELGGGTESNRQNYTKDFTITNVHPEFIPVLNAIIEFKHENGGSDKYFDPMKEDDDGIIILPVTIIPDNATHRTLTAKLVSVLEGHMDDNDDSIDLITTWTQKDDLVVFNPLNMQLTIDRNKLDSRVLYKVIFDFTIKEGRAPGVDFTSTQEMIIKGLDKDPFIPLEEFNFIMPNPVVRCFTPVLLTKYTTNPFFPTGKNKDNNKYPFSMVSYNTYPDPSEKGSIVQVIYPNSSAPGASGEITHTVKPLPIFCWTWEELYCYPWNPGIFYIDVTIKNATVQDINDYNRYNPETIDYKKTITVEVLDPYIAVKDIIGIPTQVSVNQKLVLSPEVCSDGGLKCYNPYWDDEVPTYTNIGWTFGENTAGATLNKGVLSFNNPGRLTIVATITGGIQEYLEWYGEEQYCVNYQQAFNIQIVDKSLIISPTPFLQVRLKDGIIQDNVIGINILEHMTWFCNDMDDDFEITINDIRFTKGDIIGFEFYDIDTEIAEPTPPGEPPVEPTPPGEPPVAPIEPERPEMPDFGDFDNDVDHILGPESELENWNYTLDEETKIITLNWYNSTTNNDVIVYGNYMVGNYIYKTRIANPGENGTLSGGENYMFNMKDEQSRTVTSVIFGKGIITDHLEDMGAMFNNQQYLTSVDISNIDTSNVSGMKMLFQGCSSLTNINLGGINTSKVINMASMFQGCSSLENVDLSSFDTSLVHDMHYMFEGCTSLRKIYISNFKTNRCNHNRMFMNCRALKEINISKFESLAGENDPISANHYTMFVAGCVSLEFLLVGTNLNNMLGNASFKEKMFNGWTGSPDEILSVLWG